MAEISADDKNQAKIAHILNGFIPALGGLIIWLTSKDRGEFNDKHGKVATNFGITMVIAIFVADIVAIASFGILFILPLGVWVYSIVMGFKGGGEAEKGNDFTYPIAIPILK